ncbi:hypothetical protein ABIE67_007473 [Streptomyces sp. V4I8]
MTLIQMQFLSADAKSVHRTAVEVMDAAERRSVTT